MAAFVDGRDQRHKNFNSGNGGSRPSKSTLKIPDRKANLPNRCGIMSCPALWFSQTLTVDTAGWPRKRYVHRCVN